eukprot:4040386-Pyramimonas_sp.AAC.1
MPWWGPTVATQDADGDDDDDDDDDGRNAAVHRDVDGYVRHHRHHHRVDGASIDNECGRDVRDATGDCYPSIRAIRDGSRGNDDENSGWRNDHPETSTAQGWPETAPDWAAPRSPQNGSKLHSVLRCSFRRCQARL